MKKKIISTFNNKKSVDDFSMMVSYDDIKAKNYSLSAGQFLEVKIDYVEVTKDEFNSKIKEYDTELLKLFEQSETMSKNISNNLKRLKFE